MATIIVYAPGVEETFLQQATVELLKELYRKALKPEKVLPYLDALDHADLRMASSSEEVLTLFRQGLQEERDNYLKTRLKPLVFGFTIADWTEDAEPRLWFMHNSFPLIVTGTYIDIGTRRST